LVREAQESKSQTQRLADFAAKWLFYIAIAAGTITFSSWMVLGKGVAFAIPY
jgi:Cu2+-exporting ATPase